MTGLVSTSRGVSAVSLGWRGGNAFWPWCERKNRITSSTFDFKNFDHRGSIGIPRFGSLPRSRTNASVLGASSLEHRAVYFLPPFPPNPRSHPRGKLGEGYSVSRPVAIERKTDCGSCFGYVQLGDPLRWPSLPSPLKLLSTHPTSNRYAPAHRGRLPITFQRAQ